MRKRISLLVAIAIAASIATAIPAAAHNGGDTSGPASCNGDDPQGDFPASLDGTGCNHLVAGGGTVTGHVSLPGGPTSLAEPCVPLPPAGPTSPSNCTPFVFDGLALTGVFAVTRQDKADVTDTTPVTPTIGSVDNAGACTGVAAVQVFAGDPNGGDDKANSNSTIVGSANVAPDILSGRGSVGAPTVDSGDVVAGTNLDPARFNSTGPSLGAGTFDIPLSDTAHPNPGVRGFYKNNATIVIVDLDMVSATITSPGPLPQVACPVPDYTPVVVAGTLSPTRTAKHPTGSCTGNPACPANTGIGNNKRDTVVEDALCTAAAVRDPARPPGANYDCEQFDFEFTNLDFNAVYAIRDLASGP